jgi:hypothetical protein
MQTVQQTITALEPISSIDLSMVKLKLMDAEEGLGWTAEQADRAEARYRRYLQMVQLHANRSIVPTKDIDQVWHQHILDTRGYAADCQRVFGEFVHHFPYFGMRGDADAKNLISSYEETKALYREMFGEPYEVGSDAQKCVKCGSGPNKCHHQPTRCR